MTRWVHIQNTRTNRALVAERIRTVALLIGRKRGVIGEDARNIRVAEDEAGSPIWIKGDGLRLAHLTIPAIRGVELFSIRWCLHQSVFPPESSWLTPQCWCPKRQAVPLSSTMARPLPPYAVPPQSPCRRVHQGLGPSLSDGWRRRIARKSDLGIDSVIAV